MEYLEAKTTLGRTFGTKKQKANIRAQERNKIDPSAMQGVMGYVMDSIDKGVENLPTPRSSLSFLNSFSTLTEVAEETQELANKSRLIPHFSADATDPADVYPLHSLIPEAEWKAIPIGDLEAAQTLRERGQLLPHRKSDWINYHLKKLTQKEHKNNKNLYDFQVLGFASKLTPQ